MRNNEISSQAKKKASDQFKDRSPYGWSLVSLLFGMVSLPFWSESQYQKGVECGVNNAANKTNDNEYPNAKRFLLSTVVGVILGALVGTILFFALPDPVFSMGAAIGFGALIGGGAVSAITVGTFM